MKKEKNSHDGGDDISTIRRKGSQENTIRAGENEIVTTERCYQRLCGEQYAGFFSEPKVAGGKRSEQFSIRRYTYPL